MGLDMNKDVILGMDVQENGRSTLTDSFPLAVGDVAVIRITCHMDEDPHAKIYRCPHEEKCIFANCYRNKIFEVEKKVVKIFDRGQGWLFKFADLQIEAPLSDYGTWFWKKEV